MPNTQKHSKLPLSPRDTLLSVLVSFAAAVALIAALSVMATNADARGGSGGTAPDGGGGTGTGGGGTGGKHPYLFPVPGPHTYEDGFGAGRNHQGQDIFARCGRRIIATRNARVQVSKYQSAAGYYVVLDVAGSGYDFAHMHLARRGRVREGQRVEQGDVIGFMSDTGNASGCHLHFEKWTAPGYYEGGRAARTVTRSLRKWDRYS